MTSAGETQSVWAGIWLSITVLAVCGGAFFIATGFVPATTRYFPLAISVACIGIAGFEIAKRLILAWRLKRNAMARTSETGNKAGAIETDFVNAAANAPPTVILKFAMWFFGYLVGIWLVSLVLASGLFVAGFLWREAKVRWWLALVSGAIVIGLVILAGEVFYIRWPRALLNPLAALL